jgi:FMN phosphatase YigB (HAD superfamily)
MKNYMALLLDLDGTLLNIEVSFFLGPMVKAMHRFFSDILEREKFREGLFGGTDAIMAEPRPDGKTNHQEFYRTFGNLTGVETSDAEGRFGEFYSEVFPSFRSYADPVPGAAGFVNEAFRKGYILALATNPIFPVNATIERLRWAGIDPEVFRIIPGLENMSSCKPSVRYYLDVAEIIGVDPAECLMVGNDMEQDMPASDAGMGTYLVEGSVISRGLWDREPDDRGNLEDLAGKLGL